MREHIVMQMPRPSGSASAIISIATRFVNELCDKRAICLWSKHQLPDRLVYGQIRRKGPQ